MAEKPAILLIHGACHGSWCWKFSAPHLERRGFAVHTIDLPGRDPSPRWGWRLRLRDQAAAVVAKAAAIGGQVTAVAHSMGGFPLSAAAELEPALFSRLIYLAAYLPQDGDNLFGLGGRDKTSRVGAVTRMSPLGFISIKPDRSVPVFYDDCPADRIAWSVSRLCPEPLRPAFDRIALGERFAAVPKSYIRCSEDQVVTPGLQDAMLAATPCEKVATLESSHSPFLSMPDRLVDAIEAVR